MRSRWMQGGFSVSVGLASAYVRFSLAASFLSAVGDRFGAWGGPGAPGVSWGNYEHFLAYTESLMPVLPVALARGLGSVATAAEVLLAVMLLSGFRLALAALGSSLLLAVFALCMSLSYGPKPALDYSVWTASAAALLLLVMTKERDDAHS